MHPRTFTALAAILLLVVATGGCTGTSSPGATDATRTAFEHERHLWIEYAGPDATQVRLVVEEHHEGGRQLLTETMTLRSGERRTYEHRLAENTTYYVAVETPNDTASVTLRDYNGVTFVVDGEGGIERNLEYV